MKYFKVVLLALFIIPMLAGLYWQDVSVNAANLAVTDTPTSVPATDTPVPATDTPTPVPGDTVTPQPGSTDTPTPQAGDTSTPPPATNVGTPEETGTPSTIPSLGSGPRVESMAVFGVGLLALFGIVSFGWFKVWQAYRHDSQR